VFCPQSKAEYRPGFNRCSDCDVNLVHDLPVLSTPKDRPNRVASFIGAALYFPMHLGAAGRFIEDCRATVRGWIGYKHQTGTLPWLSVAAHTANWFAVIAAMIFLFSYADKFHWSGWRLFGVLMLAAIPYGILWYRLKREIKLNQLRTQKRLRLR
jgi:hypothetical protein